MSKTARFDLERVPLRVFVVWNPAFEQGRQLASAVYAWFGGPNRIWHRSGLGVPVMFWTSSDPDEVPAEIPTKTQNYTVVVPLVDENLAGRRRWRDWMERCDPAHHQLRFWAVHPAAFQIESLSPLNPLGTRKCDPTELRRLLTESCAMLLIGSRGEREFRPLNFFISYARKDGTRIAADVRRALLEYGNVQVFMDVHDIEPGVGWRGRLEEGIERGAAMLAIVTDEYSARAWCRRELREFRTPVRTGRGSNRWWLRPVFVLDALSGNRTRSMFEIGSTPTSRWHRRAATTIIDMLIRDVLFGEVQRHRCSNVRVDSDAHVVNWVPDTWTLLELKRLAGRRELTKVVYPGDGLPQVEMHRLRDVFPELTLQTFEEASGR